MGILRFEDIFAWQKARELTFRIYQSFESTDDFGFKSQIQRASVSIMNNIAEGFERHSPKEFKQYLHISRGSCSEVRSMLYLARDLNYISPESYEMLEELCVEIGKLLSGFIKSIRTETETNN